MQDMPVYPLVPGVVLVPIEWLGLGAVASYQVALVMLSAFALAAALLLRRTVGLVVPGNPVLAAAAFAMVLLFPAHLTTGVLTWSEPTVLLWWCALCWAFGAMLLPTGPTARSRALVVGTLAAGTAPFVHGRLLLVPAIWIAVLVLAGRWARRPASAHRRSDQAVPWSAALTSGVVMAALLAAGWSMDRAVHDSLWTEPIGHDTASVRGALLSWDLWATFVTTAAGQVWYLVISTFGLAVFGVVQLVAMARRPRPPGHRVLAAAVGALALSNFALSSIAMTSGVFVVATGRGTGGIGGLRWDHLFYGRYNDALGVVLAAFGLVWLWNHAGRRVIVRISGAAGAAALACAAIVVGRASGLDLGQPIGATIAGVSALRSGRGAAALAVWTTVGLVLMAIVVVASQRGTRQLIRSVVGVLVAAAVLSGFGAVRLQRSITTAPIAAHVGDAPFDGAVATVAHDTANLSLLRLGVFGIQYQLLAQGWSMEFSQLDSAALARSAGEADDRRLVVLNDGDDPGDGWQPVLRFGGSTLWQADR